MDPKGIKLQETVDDQKIPGNADSGKGKTYAIHTIYNDGTETWQYRRYSGKGPESDPIVTTETTINEDQEKRWRASQPTATSQATAGRQQQTRVMSTNPDTGKPAWKITNYDSTVEYDENVPATVTGGVAANAKGKKGTVENGEWVEREIEPDGSQGRIVEQRPATQAEKDAASGRDKEKETKDEATRKETETKKGQWTEIKRSTDETTGKTVATFRNGLGETEEREITVTKAPEKPTIREDPNNPGKWISIQSDPSEPGGVKITSVAGPEGVKPGQGPSIADLQVRYGTVVEDLQAYASKLQDALAKGIITQAEHDKRWGEAKSVAQVKVNELNNLVTTQSGLYGQQAANWRQEQATANTRLQASTNALQLGVNSADKLTGASGQGQMGTIWSTLTAGRAAGEMYGGYASGPPPALPPAAASIMNMEINQDGSITMRPKGGAAAGGAPGATGMPAAVGSIDDAVRADVTAAAPSSGNIPGGVPRMPGGGFAPANASISGGQARLPAVVDESGQRIALPPSAAIQTLPPEILNEFDPEILAEAMAGMPEFGY